MNNTTEVYRDDIIAIEMNRTSGMYKVTRDWVWDHNLDRAPHMSYPYDSLEDVIRKEYAIYEKAM